MAEVTSDINKINIDTSGRGSGAAAFNKTIFTATKVTGPTGTPPKYKTEIVKYSDAKGTDPVTIGTRDDNGKIYHEELKGNKGFVGPSSLLYHIYPPTEVLSTKQIGSFGTPLKSFTI